MATREKDFDTRVLIPPYGPSRGTLQALQLLRRTTPPRIDSDFLRVNKIAPGNEYKVVGALRFLGLVDDEGRPTENSRLLKTKGATFTLALQEIVRNTYSGIFDRFRPRDISRDGIYNYFVTEGGLGAEMATKATRFLIKLCRLAEIEIAPDSGQQPAAAGKGRTRTQRQTHRRIQSATLPADNGRTTTPTFPFVLALTEETAKLNVDQLTDLFRKMRIALEQSLNN
ncbi:MAG: DUF5343 domain-containing protein [Dehalococcoidia bacterium]|nr:DUF5343 domain-containing protein [Dehalococcoidia bacterium]